MANSKHGKNAWILYILTGIFIIGLFVWTRYKYRLADRKIPAIVSEKSKGLYSIEYEDLKFDEVGGSLSVKNVRLKPDSAVYEEMKKMHKQPSVLIDISVPVLDIIGVQTPKALLNKEIAGGRVIVDHPVIELGIDQFMRDTSGYNPGKDIYQQILGQLKMIKIDSVLFTHANLVVKDLRTGKVKYRGSNITLILSEFLIDSLHQSDSSRVLFSKNLDLMCKEIVLPSKDRKYDFKFENIEFISQTNEVKVREFAVLPTQSEEAFAASYKYSKDRYHFILENISLHHIDREALWHKRIEADSMIVGNSSFKVYRDISLPHDSMSRVGNYPQQMLMQVPIPVNVKKIIFSHSFIEYKEKNGKSDSSGKVQFYDVHATITNVTNMRSRIARNNLCRLTFEAKFLNGPALSANLDMILRDKNGKFSVTAKMDQMHAQQLNPVLEPMALARLDKGQINSLNFHLNGNDSQSNGKLMMRYEDIHVTLLKKGDEDEFRKKAIPTLAANMIIKKSNPPKSAKKDDPKWVNVHYARDTHRSIFNLIWKSIFTGIKETAGMK